MANLPPNPPKAIFLFGSQLGISEPASVPAEDLIARFVTKECQLRTVASLPAYHAQGSTWLQESLARGAVRAGKSVRPPREPLDKQLQAARDAYLDGQLVLMVDGRQYASPGAMIPLTPDSKIALLRLALITRS